MDNDLALFPLTADIAKNGHLCLGGVDCVDLVKRWGTPLYVYDEATIHARIHSYRTALDKHYPAPARVTYASKAFLCLAIAQLMHDESVGLDVVSGGELHIALEAGVPASRIHLHGNNKLPQEIAQALEAGVGRIVVDGFLELERVAQLARERGSVACIWLRLSPAVDADTHTYRKTGILDSKFGFPIVTGDAMRAVQIALDSPYLSLAGLHAHIGSQISGLRPFSQAAEALIALAAQAQSLGFRLTELCPGGGLGIAYTRSDPAASVEDYVRTISQAVVRCCRQRSIPLPELVIEPGRSIVGQAGVALYTVGARKEIRGVRTFISVDGGMADNIRPALYSAQYSIMLANRARDPYTETVTVAGRYCESGDILMHDVRLPPTQPGDVLAVPVSGAYHLSMSSNYNQATRPAVVMVRDGTSHRSPRDVC